MFVDIIKSILPGLNSSDVKKTNIVDMIQNMNQTITETIIPNITSLEDVHNDDVNKNRILESFGKNFNLKSSKPREVLKEFKNFFTTLSGCSEDFVNDLQKYLPSIISKKTLTCRDATYLKVAYDLNSMVGYFQDFLYFALCNGKFETLPKKIALDINAGMATFGELYKVYSKNIKDTLTKLKNVSDAEYKEGDDIMIDQLFSNNSPKLNVALTNGFIYNPFYHIGIYIEDLINLLYKRRLETKRLLELKIQELKYKEQSSTGPELDKIRKQIEYYEGVVGDLVYKIDKYKTAYDK